MATFAAKYSTLPTKPRGELSKELDAKKIGRTLFAPTDPLVR